MKLLYVSCHAILEYDEVKLFSELGIDVQSNGAYRDPRGAYTLPRPGIDTIPFDQEWVDLTGIHPKTNMPAEMLEKFDTIVFMSGEHEAPLIQNWEKIKHKRVILRTIGQTTPELELQLQRLKGEGLQIVRYSPKEANIPNYAGADASIRFYKDPVEFNNWIGNVKLPVNFSQSLRGRGRFVHHDEIVQTISAWPEAKVYGNGNTDLGKLNGGEMPYKEMKNILKSRGAYIYGGTWPAPYTLSFMEAYMTGIPVVAISKKLAQLSDVEQWEFYEVDEIITNGVTGFVCDTIEEMKAKTKQLLENDALAKTISRNAREHAIKVFGQPTIQQQWKEFLGV